jgi:hypothetical protein
MNPQIVGLAMADPFVAQRLRTMDALRRDKSLTPSARLVGLEIYGHLNKSSRKAWPSQERLANLLGFNLRTVKRAIVELVKRGWMTVDRNRHYNQYILAFVDATGHLLPIGVSVESEVDGDNSDLNRGHFRPKKGDKSALKLS